MTMSHFIEQSKNRIINDIQNKQLLSDAQKIALLGLLDIIPLSFVPMTLDEIKEKKSLKNKKDIVTSPYLNEALCNEMKIILPDGDLDQLANIKLKKLGYAILIGLSLAAIGTTILLHAPLSIMGAILIMTTLIGMIMLAHQKPVSIENKFKNYTNLCRRALRKDAFWVKQELKSNRTFLIEPLEIKERLGI